MRIRILTVSVLRFGIISSLPWSRADATIFARESTSSHQPIRNENAVASSLYTFGRQTFRNQTVARLYDPIRDRRKPSLMPKAEDPFACEFRPRVSPIFQKPRQYQPFIFFERTLATSSIAAACSPNPWVIMPLLRFFETRATNSSNRGSKSFRMGDLFDFL